MSGYLFIFGNTPDLSRAELSVFFPDYTLISTEVAYVEGYVDPRQWIRRLGGTVKIAKVIARPSVLDPADIAGDLQNISSGRLSFGISSYSKDFSVLTAFLRHVKAELIRVGISSRFVIPREGNALSSVVVDKQELVELVVAGANGGWLIGRTVVVQDFTEWNKRDYGRPAIDPKVGMLPPKVARMAVNLAFPETRGSTTEERILLDPFCGMATILGEALFSGWEVIGSDQSEDVINKAKKNLEWLAKNGTWNLFISDATHVSEKIPAGSVDAVVTEPFLGETNAKFQDVKNIIKGLDKLYIGCLKDWKKVLKPGGKVVIALPEYSIDNQIFTVKKVIDNCEIYGYTVLKGPIAYYRPQAIVRRKFFVLQKYGSH